MKYIFLLSKEDLRLAKEEVLSLFNVRKHRLIDNLLFLDLDNINSADRLAYTKRIYQFLFETKKVDLTENIKEFNWQSIYKNNFCVRTHRLDNISTGGRRGWEGGLSEKILAGYIWNKLSNPKVNLTKSTTSIEFFITKDRIYVAKLVKKTKTRLRKKKSP